MFFSHFQTNPTHTLSHKLRKFLGPAKRSTVRPQLNSFFGSFRHLLLMKDPVGDKVTPTAPAEDNPLPKIGSKPTRLTLVWAGAMPNAAHSQSNLPSCWRISSLILDKRKFIPFFTAADSADTPKWLAKIENTLSLSPTRLVPPVEYFPAIPRHVGLSACNH